MKNERPMLGSGRPAVFWCLRLGAGLLALGTGSAAVIITETYTFPVGGAGGVVPDTGVPLTFGQVIAGSQIGVLTEVRVGLQLRGTTAGNGWAGDMFASLNRAGETTAILLHQPGATAGNPAGFGFDGWNVTFRDGAVNGDIHLGQPTGGDTLLSGEWQPDGRQSLNDALRSATLAGFNGLAPGAAWYLTLADLSPTGTMTVEGWSLTFIGTSVPEPEEWAVAVAAGLALFAAGHRRRHSPRPEA